METAEIFKIISEGESEVVEFKESFSDEALETIGAFSNAGGGVLLIGVQDSGKVTGIQVGKKTLEDLANRIQSGTDPRLQPSLALAQLETKSVIVIRISTGSGSPVSVRGRYFRRAGRTNQRMSHEEIMQRFRAGTVASWDQVIEDKASLSDLDPAKIEKFIEATRKEGRHPIPPHANAEEVLERLQFTSDRKPTRAAILLFGKHPQRFFQGAYIKVGRFRSLTHIVDTRLIEGTLFEQVEESMKWFRERLQTEYVITGKPQRETVWEYPLDAIREGIINAICHRLYSDRTEIQVRLYDDRLEFWNPGGLLSPLKASDLLKPHRSIRRNPLIANAFFYMGFIESWGTGTIRMADLLQNAKLGHPVFEIDHMECFRLIFLREEFSEVRLREMKLNERQIQAVLLCKKEGKITNLQYQQHFSISKRTAYVELKDLADRGIFIRHGLRGKGTYYALRSKGY